MGHQMRLVKRVEELERRVEQLMRQLRNVAESAGAALTVEALAELVGHDKVEKRMGEIARRKQEEAEEAMAARVRELVKQKLIEPVEVVDEKSLVVGRRTEPGVGDRPDVVYRVDLVTPQMAEPERQLYVGKKPGDLVEQGGVKTKILEVYRPVEKAAAAPEGVPVVKPEAEEVAHDA